jgi:hypothetical protein
VTVIAQPSPRNPATLAMVIAGVRWIDVRRDGEGFRAMLHIRQGEWLLLAEDVAFSVIFAFLALVASVPQHYAPEHDAAERAAAAEVFAAFASPLSLAA